jgi:hypothetical protein
MDEVADRTRLQNRKFHAMVRDIARQVKWAGEFIAEEDFKRIFLAAKYGQRVVPNPFGIGFVVMNSKRSRDLTLEAMAEFITELQVFGDEQGVNWTDEDDARG